MMKRIWLVGGSSGIGLEMAKLWLAKDYRLVVSSRNATHSEALQTLQQTYPKTLTLIDVDASDPTAISKAVEQAWHCYKGLDLWFYNAGIYTSMTMQEWEATAFSSMVETNYLGCVNLMCALAPYFKEQGSGEWVWNASLSSYFGLPYGGAYSAPKAALINLAESLQPELLQAGIGLRIINHGFVKTRLTAKNDFEMPELLEPSDAAAIIVKQLENSQGFEIRFPFKLALTLRLLRFLPYRLSLAMTRKLLR